MSEETEKCTADLIRKTRIVSECVDVLGKLPTIEERHWALKVLADLFGFRIEATQDAAETPTSLGTDKDDDDE